VNGGNGRVTGVFRSRRSPNLLLSFKAEMMSKEANNRTTPVFRLRGFSDRRRYSNGNIARASDFEVFISRFPVRILI